jgi:hypothetical protein
MYWAIFENIGRFFSQNVWSQIRALKRLTWPGAQKHSVKNRVIQSLVT